MPVHCDLVWQARTAIITVSYDSYGGSQWIERRRKMFDRALHHPMSLVGGSIAHARWGATELQFINHWKDETLADLQGRSARDEPGTSRAHWNLHKTTLALFIFFIIVYILTCLYLERLRDRSYRFFLSSGESDSASKKFFEKEF